MDDPQDPLRAFNGARGVLSWTTPEHVRQALRTAMQYWRLYTCTCPVKPNLPVIESMMYGCRVAEVVDILRTFDTPVQVCDALAGERAFVAEQLAAYLGALAARRQAQFAQPPQPPQPWQPPRPPGPPPGRARFSPGPGAGRAPPAAAQSSRNAAAAGEPPPFPARAAAAAAPPAAPPRWGSGGPRDPLYEAWGDLAPPIAFQPRRSSSVGREVASSRGASVRPSPCTDIRLHGKGQGGATRVSGAAHRTRGMAQDRDAGRGQRRSPRSPSRGSARAGKAAPEGASGRPPDSSRLAWRLARRPARRPPWPGPRAGSPPQDRPFPRLVIPGLARSAWHRPRERARDRWSPP